MKRKGFTLIELLAVIVVLAIIALIATPIVMNTIEKSKKGAAERTADSYVRATETYIATFYVENGFFGEISETIPVEDLNEFIEIKGDKPTSGWVEIEQGVVVDYKLKIGDYKVTYDKEKKTGVATKIEDVIPSIIYRWSKGVISIGDTIDEFTEHATTDPTTLGRNTYLKHVLDKDGKVIESYACAIFNSKEYCLKNGEYGDAENEGDYTGSALILKNLRDENIEGISCGFNDSSVGRAIFNPVYISYCFDDSIDLWANSKGYLAVESVSGGCGVAADGSLYCASN